MLVTGVTCDQIHMTYQSPLATERRMHYSELEDQREQLEVDYSHLRER